MPTQRGDDPGGGGSPGAPSPPDHAAASIVNRQSAAAARATVRVHQRDLPDVLGEGPLKFEGAGLTAVWDGVERRSVITVNQVLFGTAAARPATPATPAIYIATDTGAHSSWDGTTWRTI
jgi:hypothetical protein